MSILFSISWFFLTFDFAEITFARQKKKEQVSLLCSRFFVTLHTYFLFFTDKGYGNRF
jgi:hypothetical protein